MVLAVLSTIILNLSKLSSRLFNLNFVFMSGCCKRLLKLVDIVEFLLSKVHFLISSFENFIHFILMVLDHLKGATCCHNVGGHLRLSERLGHSQR